MRKFDGVVPSHMRCLLSIGEFLWNVLRLEQPDPGVDEAEHDADPGEHERPAEVVLARILDDVLVGNVDVLHEFTAVHQVAFAMEERDANCERHSFNEINKNINRII